jgi:hypothetical protein
MIAEASLSGKAYDVNCSSLRGANGSGLLAGPMTGAATKQSTFIVAALWIASRSLSSGAHSRDPLARNDVDI